MRKSSSFVLRPLLESIQKWKKLKLSRAGMQIPLPPTYVKLNISIHFQLSKAEKTNERRDRQLRDMGNKLDLAQQERDAASTKATQLMDQLEFTNAEFDKTKQSLNSTSKELRVRKL